MIYYLNLKYRLGEREIEAISLYFGLDGHKRKNFSEIQSIMKIDNDTLDKIVKDEVRREITEDKIRPDGRALTEIRPLASRVDVLPRTHGSALFTRGQTQALTSATLAPLGEYQVIDGLGIEEGKRFIHHYNFPPYSTGETGRVGSPKRREIGHGALAERAITPVLPSREEFPYAIRQVSEALGSNGSTSMGSVCASSRRPGIYRRMNCSGALTKFQRSKLPVQSP